MNLETVSIARQRELRQLSLDIQAGGMAFGEEHKRRANLVSEATI
jgi:hypothetical protein